MSRPTTRLRTFRLDRVDQVEPLETPFEPPAGFDTLRHLSDSLASLPRARAIEVWLDTDLATARRELSPMFGVLEPAEGGVRLRGQADSLAWFARELARLSFDFVVRRPAALRHAVGAQAERLARLAASR